MTNIIILALIIIALGGLLSLYLFVLPDATLPAAISDALTGAAEYIGIVDAVFPLLDLFIINGVDPTLMIYPDSSATGKKNVQYYNASWVKTNVLGSSTASDIVYVDYDSVSKWYLSLENGTVIDQTGTSIGISFIGGTTGATTAPIPPIVRYIPELAGWFAIEYNNNLSAVTSITYQPKVYFRPDSTQIWGQISTLPSSYKAGYASAVAYNPRVFYWSGKLYLFGFTKVNESSGVGVILIFPNTTWLVKMVVLLGRSTSSPTR